MPDENDWPTGDWQTPEQKRRQRRFDADELQMWQELFPILAKAGRFWKDCQPACRRARTCLKLKNRKLKTLSADQRAAMARSGLPVCLATAPEDTAQAELAAILTVLKID